MAASEAAKARTAETKNRQQEGPPGPPNVAEPDALSDLFPGRQSCRIPSAVAPVIRGSDWRQKGAVNETSQPLPKPIALPQEQ